MSAESSEKRKMSSWVLEDLELIKKVGVGSFGTVWAARSSDKSHHFALKVVDAKRAEVEERDILQTLDHPFIVRLFFSFQVEGTLYLGLTWVPGGDFHKLLRSLPNERFTSYGASFYAGEVVLAIEYLHDSGIMYRDLKPENTLLGSDGHVVLTDFGLAKDNVRSFGEGAVDFAGTPDYIAPEQLQGGHRHGLACDWWSLGVFLFELLAGCHKTPFHTGNTQETLKKILSDKTYSIAFPAYFPVTAMHMIQKLLTKDPMRRLGSHGGANEIRSDPYFASMDWKALLAKEMQPPCKPDPDLDVLILQAQAESAAKLAARPNRLPEMKETLVDHMAEPDGHEELMGRESLTGAPEVPPPANRQRKPSKARNYVKLTQK